MKRGIWLGVLRACALAVSFPLAANAARLPEAPPEPPSAWTFDGGLYAWAIWLQGDVTARGLNFDVYADPIDLIDALDGPIITATFEAKRGPFALYTDILYADFGYDASFLKEVNPIAPLTLGADGRVGADYKFGVYQAVGFYQVARTTDANGNDTTLELGPGARWFRQKLDITLHLDSFATLKLKRPRLAKRLDFSRNRDLAFAKTSLLQWVDPTVAARVKHAFGDGQSVTAMGDVGGFSSNDFSWQALVTYDWDGKFLGFDTTTSVGYKALGIKFNDSTSTGTRGVDVVLHGPMAELKVRW